MKTVAAVVALCALPATASAASIACVAEANSPDLAPDAQTVALLTCDALRARGVDVGQPTDAAVEGAAYRVGLHRLGEQYIIRIARERAPGQPDKTEQIRLATLSDIDRAAPRLAEAMTGGRNLEESQEMQTVTRAEARKMEKKDGEFLWGIEMFGVGFGGTDAIGAFGFGGSFGYETPEMGITVNFRGGGAGGSNSTNTVFTEFTIGGRYFFSPSNTSVFIGGGVGGMFLSHREGDDYELPQYSGGGLGGYGELGVEFLRLHGSRLSIEGRVSAPMFRLSYDDDDYYYDYDDAARRIEDDKSSVYVMPVTVGVSYKF